MNIIFFTWHDAGDWFGCYGHETVNTPNVDRLAREGVVFANNFSACAICSPSRAALMTGRHPQATGVMRLTNTPFDQRIHPHLTHLARRVKSRGYRSALFGVQHESAHEHTHEVMDFDEQFVSDPWPNADRTARCATQWLAERKGDDRPFYMQVGTFEAHLNRFYDNRPPQSDEPYPPVQDTGKGLFLPPYLEDNEAGRATVATLQGLLKRGDRLMGAILDTLDATGLAENTLLVMCVDHGVGLPRAKASCYDPGHKTAWIMRWPGRIPPGHRVNTLSTHVDVLPTLLDLLGWESDGKMDGVSFAAHARGVRDDEIRDATFGHMVENLRMIRTHSHKLIRNFRPVGDHAFKGDCGSMHRGFPAPDRPVATHEQTPCADFPALELYDLRDDPHETRNLAFDPAHAETLARLDARLWNFLIETDDFVIHEPLRTPWQVATYQDFAAHCVRSGHPVPTACGPLGCSVDAGRAAAHAQASP